VHLSTVSNIYGGTGWTSSCTCYLDGSLIRQGLSRTDMLVQRVGHVVHGDAGSVTLHLEIMDTVMLGWSRLEASLASLWRASRYSGVGGDGLVDDFDGDDAV